MTAIYNVIFFFCFSFESTEEQVSTINMNINMDNLQPLDSSLLTKELNVAYEKQQANIPIRNYDTQDLEHLGGSLVVWKKIKLKKSKAKYVCAFIIFFVV